MIKKDAEKVLYYPDLSKKITEYLPYLPYHNKEIYGTFPKAEYMGKMYEMNSIRDSESFCANKKFTLFINVIIEYNPHIQNLYFRDPVSGRSVYPRAFLMCIESLKNVKSINFLIMNNIFTPKNYDFVKNLKKILPKSWFKKYTIRII